MDHSYLWQSNDDDDDDGGGGAGDDDDDDDDDDKNYNDDYYIDLVKNTVIAHSYLFIRLFWKRFRVH